MVGNEFYVEELLCNDAAKIVIDEEAKRDLKNRLMQGDKYNNITDIPKQTKRFKQNKYLKIASGFVICVFVSGTILKVIDVPSKNMFSLGEGSPDVIMSIESEKGSDKSGTKKSELAQSKEAEGSKGALSNEQTTPKGTNAIATNNPSEETSADTNISNSNVNSGESDAEINAEINAGLVKSGNNASASTEVKGPVNVPKMDTINKDTDEILNAYDSRYSSDKKRVVNVKSGGIYIKTLESSKEQKIVAYDEKVHIINKPNFMPNDGIIYYKAEKVTLENGSIAEKNGAIYICDKNGEASTKIVDGKNPMISKDGKKLVYEAEGKIFILTLGANSKIIVDIGKCKYPAWSDNGNFISYVKEDIEKRFSSLWVYDLATGNTRSLTSNEVNINNNSIESWAEAVRSESITNDFEVTSPHSYFESIWSSTNKEIYVIRKDNKAQVFEFVRFNLDK